MTCIAAGFTRKEHAETDLDYSGARYSSGTLGRFTSADAPFMDQTVANRFQSVFYHWRRHGRAAGKTFEQYTRDALAFFNQNKSMATQVTLKDGTPGLLIRLPKGQPGGYFKPTGEVVTFWYR